MKKPLKWLNMEDKYTATKSQPSISEISNQTQTIKQYPEVQLSHQDHHHLLVPLGILTICNEREKNVSQ